MRPNNLEIVSRLSKVTYLANGEREVLSGPKFSGIYWLGIPEGIALVGREIEIYNRRSIITVAGFQGGVENSYVQLHKETDENESVFFVSGEGEMDIWSGVEVSETMNPSSLGRLQTWWNLDLAGSLTLHEAESAKYELAIATSLGFLRMEKLILNVTTGDRVVQIEPVTTMRGHHHRTRLVSPSLYFVVKHKPVEIQ